MHRTAAAVLLALAAVPALAAVTGSVMTPDGTAVPGARVMLFAPESAEARRARLLSESPERVPLFVTQTDARGAWSLESPKDPVADLRVTAAGYDPHQRRIERDEEVGAVMLFKSELKSGTVRAGGKPVAGATVVLSYNGAEYLAKTDAEGKYSAPDPKRARSITVIHPSWAIEDETFMTSASANALNRTLTAGTAISGKVVAADGTTPVAKAAIQVDSWPVAVSADDGTFTIAHAPANWTSVVAHSGSLLAMRAPGGDKALTLRLGKPATITGRVTDARTKLPVAGATVRAGGRARGIFGEGWTTLTDAKGNYTLVVPPGTYMAIATHPGYSVGPLDVTVAAGQSSSKDFSATPFARVSGVVMSEDRKPVAAASISGEEVSDDFGRMAMRMVMMGTSNAVSGPDGKFTARVQGDADMRVRASRKGLPVAKSDAFRLAPGDRKSGIVVTVPNGIAVNGKVTDREGKPLSGVAVTTMEAVAGPRGMIRQMIVLGGAGSDEDPVRTGSDGTFTIRVKEGTHDFTFRREGYSAKIVRGQTVSVANPPAIETTLEPAVEISGRVVRNGNGIEGVLVSTFSEMGAGGSAVTGPDGSFTLPGLTPGDTRMNLRKETDFISEMRNISAPARDVVIELPAGTTVSGRVIDKETRKPIPMFQAGISTSRSGGGMVMMAPPQLRSFTSDDGTFTLENIPLGGVNLIANAPGYAQARMNVTLEEGKPLRGVELELDPGTKLVGKVTGPDGAALSGATIRVAPFGSGGIVMPGAKQTNSDSNGEYVLEALEPTDTNIEYSHPKYVGTRKEITVKGREVRQDVQLSAGQRITGVVVTEAGAPVPEADVDAAAGAGSFRSTRTDANGQFSFDSLVNARYRFTASKRGFSDARVDDVDITAGAPVRLVLRSGAVVYGQVRGLSAEELGSATVDARGSDGSSSSTTVDAAGNYRLEGAPVGTVRVSATVSRNFTSRKSTTPQTVTLAAGESQNVNLEFRSDTVIRGRVTRNQRPLSSAGVMFTPKRGSSTQSSSSVNTDEQGNYTVSGLEPGEYSVYVMDMQRFSPYQTTYEVRGSATFDIDYKTAALRGRVLSSEGDPVVDARVTLRSTSTEGFRGDLSAGTDVNGSFTIDNVAAGTYTVTADKTDYGNYVTEVTVTDDGAPNVELRLSKNPGVVLKVVDARNGQPLSAVAYAFDGAGRFVQDSGMRFGGTMDSAADTKLSLSPGSYVVTVTSMGYAPVSISLTAPGTQTVPLTPGGKLIIRSSRSDVQRIRLIDSRGLRYPRTPNRPPASDLAAKPGFMQLDNVAPGSYRIEVLTNNDTIVVKSVPVVVTEGAVAEVDV